jgi:hypothetical protein
MRFFMGEESVCLRNCGAAPYQNAPAAGSAFLGASRRELRERRIRRGLRINPGSQQTGFFAVSSRRLEHATMRQEF